MNGFIGLTPLFWITKDTTFGFLHIISLYDEEQHA